MSYTLEIVRTQDDPIKANVEYHQNDLVKAVANITQVDITSGRIDLYGQIGFYFTFPHRWVADYSPDYVERVTRAARDKILEYAREHGFHKVYQVVDESIMSTDRLNRCLPGWTKIDDKDLLKEKLLLFTIDTEVFDLSPSTGDAHERASTENPEGHQHDSRGCGEGQQEASRRTGQSPF